MARTRPLRRVLGAWDGAAIAVGIIIGSGIFRTPGQVARATGSVSWSLAAWVIGGLLATIDALIIAELASLYPRAGGNYVYLKNAFGPFPAFLNGWLSSLVTYPASLAALAVFFSECVARLLGRGGMPLMPVAYGLLIGLALWNGLGISFGRFTQDVFAAGKVALLLLVLAAALLLPAHLPVERPPAPAVPVGFAMLAALGAVLLPIMWTYDGYSDVAVMAGEMKDPGRTVPRALIASMATVTVVYLLANAAFFLVLPLPLVASSDLIVSDVAAALLGPTGDMVVTLIAMVSAFGALNGVMLAGPRITYAIARDGLMFRRLSFVSRGQTPVLALALQVAMAIALTFHAGGQSAFEILSESAIFVIWLITFFAALALVVFRFRYPDAARPFRLPLYPWSFAIHIVVSFAFLASTVRFAFDKVKIGLAILLLGVPVYFLWRALFPLAPSALPLAPGEPEPEDPAREL